MQILRWFLWIRRTLNFDGFSSDSWSFTAFDGLYRITITRLAQEASVVAFGTEGVGI